MPHKGPHISIAPDYVVNRILRINIDDFAEWPESAQSGIFLSFYHTTPLLQQYLQPKSSSS